jgi:hypothetical protein
MCESGIFGGGYLQIGWDTKIDLRIIRNCSGSCANRPSRSSGFRAGKDRGGRRPWWVQSPASQTPKSSIELGKQKRRSWGTCSCAHQSWRSREGAGIWRSTRSRGSVQGGAPASGARQCDSGDAEQVVG